MNQEHTYLGTDGLAYYSVCGEPVEAYFPNGGFMGIKKHSRQCVCVRRANEEEEKARREKEYRELVLRNTRICFEEKRIT